MKTKKQIIKDSEELSNDPQLREALGDADKYQSLLALQNLEGGIILLSALKRDAVSDVDNLISRYKEASHVELLALVASLDAKLQILRLINRAKTNLEGVESFIDELVK